MLSYFLFSNSSLLLVNAVASQRPDSVSRYIEGDDNTFFSVSGGSESYILAENQVYHMTEETDSRLGVRIALIPVDRDYPSIQLALAQKGGIQDGEASDGYRGRFVEDLLIGQNGVFDKTQGVVYPFEEHLMTGHYPATSATYRLVMVSQKGLLDAHAMLFRRNSGRVDQLRFTILRGHNIESATVAGNRLYYVTLSQQEQSYLWSIDIETSDIQLVAARPRNGWSGSICVDRNDAPYLFSYVVASADERYVHFLAANRVWTYAVRQ